MKIGWVNKAECATATGALERLARVGSMLLLLLASSLISSERARGEAPVETRFDRWQPNIQLAVGLHNQTVRVHGSSTLGASGRGSRPILTSLFAVNGGLTSPAVVSGYGKPRVYIRGGYKFPVAEESRLLDENKAVTPNAFQADPSACGSNVTAGTRSCEHGLRLGLQIQGMWNVGMGVQFTFPVREQEVKLDLGLEYLGEKLQYTSAASRVDRGATLGGGNGQILDTVVLPRVALSDYVHSLGPRFAAAVNVGSLGPFQVVFNVETLFYFYPSAYDTELGGTTAAGTQSFRVQSKQPFITQAAGGITVVWH